MNPEALAPTDPGRLRGEYRRQVAADTLRAGRALSGLCIAALVAILAEDYFLLGLPDVWGYRIAGMVPAALFLLGSFTILRRRADLVVPSHAVVLTAILSQGAAVTVWLFVNKPTVLGWESGSTSALLVVMLSASVFAAGARPWIPWLIGATLATVIASLGLLGTMKSAEWPLLSDAVIAGAAIAIVSVFQERMTFREFVARHLALARKTEIERQAEELRRHRDRLEERVAERTHELEAANEALRNDIARRENAERALQASEARYRALVQQAPVGIAITEGVPPRMVFANEMLGRMVGTTPEDLVAMGPEGLRDLIHPEDRLAFLVATRARVEGDPGDVPRRIRVVRRDGETRWFEIDLGPVDLAGRPAWQFLFTDVTDRLRWEEERDRLQRIESLSMMAGGIAHDFNNLLTGIQGNLGLARLQVAPADPVLLRLDQAELAATQAAALVGQLVALTRGGAPVREVLSLPDLVSRTASLAVTGTGTRCEFAFEPGLWSVEVDATQVTQVIQNLVLNAVQAMPGGGVLRIGARNVPEGARPAALPVGRFVEVTFEDEGHGIADEHLDRIFDPYFSTKPRGSGLGLTVVYSVVTKHGGCVTVDSRPGDGATFHVFLPASGRVAGAERPTPLPDLPRGRERLLVMDDEHVVREVCVQILRHLGYEVDAAGWGEEAVEMYAAARDEGRPYDAVLLDLTVPGGMGGAETLAALRILDPDVKAIATSGYSDDPAIADHRRTGFAAGLAKPFSPMALGQVVRRVLGRKGPLSSGSLPKV